MEQLINNILIVFRSVTEHLSVEMVTLLEPSVLVCLHLGFVLLMLRLVFNHGAFVGGVCNGVLMLGFSWVLFLRGAEWMQLMTDGVRHVGQHLGLVAFNPGSILALGSQVVAPIQYGTAQTGFMNFLLHPSSILWEMAGNALWWAFFAAAGVQFFLLLWNYTLIALAPFMLVFFALPGLRTISEGWVSMALGNLAGLMASLVTTTVLRELGADMANRYTATYVNATTTPGWAESAEVLGVAVLAALVFAWVPYKFCRLAGSLGSAFIGGLAGFAGAAMTATRIGMSGGSGNSNQSGGNNNNRQLSNGGSQPQITAQGSSGGGSMGSAQQPKVSAWSKP